MNTADPHSGLESVNIYPYLPAHFQVVFQYIVLHLIIFPGPFEVKIQKHSIPKNFIMHIPVPSNLHNHNIMLIYFKGLVY